MNQMREARSSDTSQKNALQRENRELRQGTPAALRIWRLRIVQLRHAEPSAAAVVCLGSRSAWEVFGGRVFAV